MAQTDIPEMLSHGGWVLRFTAFHFRHIHLFHSSWPSPSRRRMSTRRMTPETDVAETEDPETDVVETEVPETEVPETDGADGGP